MDRVVATQYIVGLRASRWHHPTLRPRHSRPHDFNTAKKLLLSKWTAIKPVAKERHFLVTKVVATELEGGKVEWIDLEAVHSRSIRRMEWIELRDSAQWVRGWV